MTNTDNGLGYALVQWLYRAPSGRLVRIRQYHPTDHTPPAILTRQRLGLPYTKSCLIHVDPRGACYEDLSPTSVADHQGDYLAQRTAQHLALCARASSPQTPSRP